MSTTDDSQTTDEARNADPLSGESGAHPVATGVGAAAVGAAGLVAAAAVAGPLGVVVAAVGGAMIGGYVGKAAGEVIDPTVEEKYWRTQHAQQPETGREPYQDFALAYRAGYEGYGTHGARGSFEEAEPKLRAGYEAGGASLPWERARGAAHAAWDRVHRRATQPGATSEGFAETVTNENLQTGALGNAQMPR